MKIIANKGNSLHAPENSKISLASGYTSGADMLAFNLQLTKDGKIVLFGDNNLTRLTGQNGVIIDYTLEELDKFDFCKNFSPDQNPKFKYYHNTAHSLKLETFPEILDFLPSGTALLIEIMSGLVPDKNKREQFIKKVVTTIQERKISDKVILYTKDKESDLFVKKISETIQTVSFSENAPDSDVLALINQSKSDGVILDIDEVLLKKNKKMELTSLSKAIQELYDKGLKLGILVYTKDPRRKLEQEELDVLQQYPHFHSLSTGSVLSLQPLLKTSYPIFEESFSGKHINTRKYWLGYAKSNKYAHVYQEDGVLIDIKEYDSWAIPSDEFDTLKVRFWFAEKSWPFYSGGGLAVAEGIEGDFNAEVEYEAMNTSQGATLEMSVTNIDPGVHQHPWNPDGSPNLPTTIRDKDSFYDPHGCPPYVGVEHDEDDGYRINWNLGYEYDNNQYGKPVGDGKFLSGVLRLERRGSYFSAYYKNANDALNWICIGQIKNMSLNQKVFLRCAAKRWRKEMPNSNGQFYPLPARKTKFKNLVIKKS